MNCDDLADATHAAKATEALLCDARSALRWVEKLTAAALATNDGDAHHLAGAAQRTLEQLVDHLVLAKQQRNREVQRALHTGHAVAALHRADGAPGFDLHTVADARPS